MKLAISDKCKESFHEIKFNKKYRYILYKVEGEKVVLTLPFRLRKATENEHRHGKLS